MCPATCIGIDSPDCASGLTIITFIVQKKRQITKGEERRNIRTKGPIKKSSQASMVLSDRHKLRRIHIIEAITLAPIIQQTQSFCESSFKMLKHAGSPLRVKPILYTSVKTRFEWPHNVTLAAKPHCTVAESDTLKKFPSQSLEFVPTINIVVSEMD